MPKKKSRKPARAKRSLAAQKSAKPTLKNPILRPGEEIIGTTVHENRAHQLIVVSIDAIDQTDHAAALAYAKKMGGDLPSRIDGLVLHARAKAKFKTDRYYWTNEAYAGYSRTAWTQWFYGGGQDTWFKSSAGRVCVVRRLPL